VRGAPSSITGPASSPLWVLPSEELDRGCCATGRGGREVGRGVAMGREGGREALGPAKTRVHYRGEGKELLGKDAGCKLRNADRSRLERFEVYNGLATWCAPPDP
jgi:hypothetical protein